MHGLPLTSVPHWEPLNNRWCPRSVNTICPYCSRMVTLTLSKREYDNSRNTFASSAECPSCRQWARFWVIDPSPTKDTTIKTCAFLGIFPKPRILKNPVVSPDKVDHPALARAYLSAFDAYNSGLWDACSVSCRKTLEGLVQALLPAEDRMARLSEQLKKLPEKVNLSEPLIALADSIRKGGNLGAHFDLERESDQHTSELMLDLLDFFMEYVYLLKEKAQTLEEKIDKMKPEEKN